MKELYLSAEQLEKGLAGVLTSPQDQGVVMEIVVRPGIEKRVTLDSVRFSPADGIEGDRWVDSPGPAPDGRPNPEAQVSLMDFRVIRFLAGSEARIPLAGDNLVVDLDLGADNLPSGQNILVGEVLLQITNLPHTGCGKFAQRFGADATRWVNSSQHKHLHLRGRFARIMRGGTVRCGDVLQKVPPSAGA